VSESGGGNWEMSTFVPVEAKGGMMLHPGPGPFAAGPGPFPPRSGLSCSCSCSCVFLSAADTATETSVIAAAVAEISTKVTRFDILLIFILLPPCLYVFINPPSRFLTEMELDLCDARPDGPG